MRRAWTIAVLLLLVVADRSKAETSPASGGATRAPALSLGAPVHHVDRLAREPMLVEHPGGALFVSGFGSQVTGTDPRASPHLWKSVDGGASWQSVDVGGREEGAIGNSDVDLAVAADGTLYFASMGFDRSTRYGTHVAIGVSHDVGVTWKWTLLSEDRGDDRPWVVVAPEGTAHVIWNDGSGVSHAASRDRGKSWQELAKIHPAGGSSHLAVGSRGELAVRVTPLSASGQKLEPEVDLLVVSGDGGGSWEQREVPGKRAWSSDLGAPNVLPRWVEPLAWDAAGALYYLWSEGRELRLARSRDRGVTWKSWQVAKDAEIGYFPFLTARGEGELAATWFSGRDNTLQAHLARITVPESAAEDLEVRRSPPFQPDSWLERPGQRTRSAAGEYIPVVFLSNGDLGVVTPVQDLEGGRFGFSWWRSAAPVE
jgi:hypothetical protein